MGFSSYYRRFVENFSKVAYPITSLQNKDTKFVWTSKCKESFQRLKCLLTTTSILKITYLVGEFVVCNDACKEGVGGVLLQDDHVVYYESRKLKELEWNYATYDLELISVIQELKVWRHYLLGKIFLLKKTGLKYLFDQQNLNSH